jgi:hypothetical protein
VKKKFARICSRQAANLAWNQLFASLAKGGVSGAEGWGCMRDGLEVERLRITDIHVVVVDVDTGPMEFKCTRRP